jgi:hypothetical protein
VFSLWSVPGLYSSGVDSHDGAVLSSELQRASLQNIEELVDGQ